MTTFESQVAGSGSSFYWAMRLLPEERREALYAIYAFCRVVDDIADDGSKDKAKKLAELAKWHDRIDHLHDSTTDSLSTVLAKAAFTFELRLTDFHCVIDGMEMDANGPIKAPPLVLLDLYCDRVASAVGRLCMPVFGDVSPHGQALAYHLGRALQLTNIARDVEEDAAMGRLYIPEEYLSAAGISATDPHVAVKHPNLYKARAMLGTLADTHFEQAAGAMERCNSRAVKPARVMMMVYRRLWRQLRDGGWQALPKRRGVARVADKTAKFMIALRYGWLS